MAYVIQTLQNTKQDDCDVLFDPSDMLIEEDGTFRCGMFEFRFTNIKSIAQQENEYDSWIHCFRNMISRLSRQKMGKSF